MLGIIGALDEEISLLLAKLHKRSIRTYAGITFYRGWIGKHQVVICTSGVGKVNAAMTTQALLNIYRVRQIVFTGTAGALLPTLNIGDLVISTKTQQYDVNFTAIGYPKGVIPALKTSIFIADPVLVRAAKRGAQSMKIKGKVIQGKILTGDRFVANQVLARYLQRRFHGLCVEAEGAATGQVCFRNHIPYIVIRGMSDKAGRHATKNFERFSTLAARRAQRLVLAMLRELPAEKSLRLRLNKTGPNRLFHTRQVIEHSGSGSLRVFIRNGL